MGITSPSFIQFVEAKPYGITKAEWSERWWKWFLGNSNGGRYQSPDQPVYFIPGKWMVRKDKTILDTFNEIPQGKSILTPIDNWLSFGSLFTSDKKMRETAIKRTDSLVYMKATVDDTHVAVAPEPALRITTDIFLLDVSKAMQRQDEETGKWIKAGKYKVLSDGYWLFIKSLPLGTHYINISCSCRTSELTLEIRHRVNIT